MINASSTAQMSVTQSVHMVPSPYMMRSHFSATDYSKYGPKQKPPKGGPWYSAMGIKFDPPAGHLFLEIANDCIPHCVLDAIR